ncbi:MAG: glycosyltransferase, partial [Victivallaceae bacterium]
MAKTAVLLPVYNGEKFLRECIDSILFQSHKEFALIICDDFSSDGSLEILQRYAAVDSRIKILHNDQNLGIAATRNKLLQALPAECDFIAIMDADDVMFPERLEQQLGYLEEHPDIAAVGTALEIIDEQGRNVGYRKYPTSSDDLRKNILKSNPISQSSLMLRRKVIDAIGLYRTDMAVCEDYDYWLRAMLKFNFVNLPH